MNKKTIMMWQTERDAAVRSYDVETFKAFYRKWLKLGMYDRPLPKDDMVIEITMRKMMFHMSSASRDEKEEAKRWLLERGFDTQIG